MKIFIYLFFCGLLENLNQIFNFFQLFNCLKVDILSKLNHPNIVSYKESFQIGNGCLSIVMGYCEGGDLYTRLKEQAKLGKYLTETQVVEWFIQIAMALQVRLYF